MLFPSYSSICNTRVNCLSNSVVRVYTCMHLGIHTHTHTHRDSHRDEGGVFHSCSSSGGWIVGVRTADVCWRNGWTSQSALTGVAQKCSLINGNVWTTCMAFPGKSVTWPQRRYPSCRRTDIDIRVSTRFLLSFRMTQRAVIVASDSSSF